MLNESFSAKPRHNSAIVKAKLMPLHNQSAGNSKQAKAPKNYMAAYFSALLTMKFF